MCQFGRGDGPVAIMICCAGIGDAPEHLSQARPGDLFVLQNRGNRVPVDSCEGSTVNAIEFALRKLCIRDIVVCGHLECPVVLGSLRSSCERELPTQQRLKNGERTRALIEKHYADLSSELQANIVVQENVLVQLENLMAHPHIRQRIQQRDIRLHGWLLDDRTRRVWHYDPEFGQFDDY